MKRNHHHHHLFLKVERLESRCLLAGDTLSLADAVQELSEQHGEPTVVPAILAGVSFGGANHSDSPAQRVDPNVASSPYAAVGALEVFSPTFPPGVPALCTASLIAKKYILTAAHCFDLNNDGVVDAGIEANFVMNVNGNRSHVIPIARDSEGVPQIFVHKDFEGLPNPPAPGGNDHDDIAVVKIARGQTEGNVNTLPDWYKLRKKPIQDGQRLTLVGYGASGNADEVTYAVSASSTVKRVGQNIANFFTPDDEGSGVNEIYGFDFDEPFQGIPKSDGGTLGNQIETQLGPGDSGGPAFVGAKNFLAGVNTGTILFPGGFFPSVGFGMDVSAYATDIKALIKGQPSDFILAGGASAAMAASAGPALFVGVEATVTAVADLPANADSLDQTAAPVVAADGQSRRRVSDAPAAEPIAEPTVAQSDVDYLFALWLESWGDNTVV